MSYGPPPQPPPPPPGGYGPPPGGMGPPGGYGPPGGFGQPPQQPADQGMVIGALIASIIGFFGICVLSWIALPLPIAALVLSIIAMTQRETNPGSARTCALIAYVCVGVAFAIGILMFILAFGSGLMGYY